MAKIRILISEGNEKPERDKLARFNGCAPSGMLDTLLTDMRPDIETEIFCPTDVGAHPANKLDEYDGILFTGSTANIYNMTPSTRRQIEFARRAFESGTPMFGICWGLQLATVAAGGEVSPSRDPNCRCEVPFSPEVVLTDDGRRHRMHNGRSAAFDTFGFHSDQVTKLPDNCTVTATNVRFIQALEIRGSKSVFWGVQYHPELIGSGAAGFMRGCRQELVEAGIYRSDDDVERVAGALDRFLPGIETAAPDTAILGLKDSSKFEFRPLEIMNWLEQLVIPTKNSTK